MVITEMINQIFISANDLLDWVFFWGGWLLILGYPVIFFVGDIYKNRKTKRSMGGEIGDLLLQTFILFLFAFLAGITWSIPEILSLLYFAGRGEIFPWAEWIWVFTFVRWIELSLLLLVTVRFFAYEYDEKSEKYGEKRWLDSALGHIAILFIGLILFNRWFGLVLITLPALIGYYVTLYSLAVVLVPVSNPEDRAERRKRFIVLVSYSWGVQFPMYVVDGHAWEKLEARIPGDSTLGFLHIPGLIWTRAHQVVAITSGNKFKRIDGPGVVFTGSYERPLQVFDLRLQMRGNKINAVSKDGIRFKARVFTSFRLDPEIWDEETIYHPLRQLNAALRGADKPDYTLGSFPFSKKRIQVTLGVTSTQVDKENTLIYWDQWVLNLVEKEARQVLSQKNLDELWRPSPDGPFANALAKITKELKDRVYLPLRSAGILVLAAQIEDFDFPGEKDQIDDVSEQQIATWGSEWEGRSSMILAEAQAESEYMQQEARAYAESVMLNAIAESLQKTQEINPNLPRYVIAMRFLSTLQDFVRRQPGDKTIQDLQERLKEIDERFSRNWGQEGLP